MDIEQIKSLLTECAAAMLERGILSKDDVMELLGGAMFLLAAAPEATERIRQRQLAQSDHPPKEQP